MATESTLGRYTLHGELAAGGMATVHLGRLLGPAGFARTVAIKRLHAQYAKEPDFVSMFLDEARLAARVRHPNVVSTLDVVVADGEIFLVMDYVHGESLSRLMSGGRVPVPIAVGIVSGVLAGLHAAHEARDEDGEPLHIIHRDVSPQNILVGADGISRVLDFGVAKATRRLHSTRDGNLKGKLRYMAPEQLRGEPIDRRVDVFSACVVLWEMLTGERLFQGEEPSVYVTRLLDGRIEPPRTFAPDLPPSLDLAVTRGLAVDRDARFASARDLALALEDAVVPATTREIGEWVEQTSAAELEERVRLISGIERDQESRGMEMPTGLTHLVEGAGARAARARMETALSLHGHAMPEEPTETETVALPARKRRIGIGVGVVLVALSAAVGALAAWPRAAPPRPSTAGTNAPEALTPAPPASLDPLDPPAPASAGPESTPDVAQKPRSKALPVSRPPTKPAKPATSPSAKSTPCMKQRADGIVYFEPCP
jgi:eukaryotic-like serine/threonine-protein kinase